GCDVSRSTIPIFMADRIPYRLVCSQGFCQVGDPAEVFQTDGRRDGVVGGEDVAAVLLDDGYNAAHLRLDLVGLVPEDGVDAAVEDEFVAELLLERDGVHARLDFKRVERVEA